MTTSIPHDGGTAAAAPTPFYPQLRALLASTLGEREARAVALALLDDVGGLTTADVLMGRADRLDPALRQSIVQQARRIARGEPYQYVVGFEHFCGLRIDVCPGVLIPRPETEELVAWIAGETTVPSPRILDLGTGSGCIALALKHLLPQARVEAWDIDPAPIRVAEANARRLRLDIGLRRQDMLQVDETLQRQLEGQFDILVSNPPYVCQEEKADMEANVLDHEPALALFVPDDDPLRFYRAVARLGRRLLRPDGHLYFEINRRFGDETRQMLLDHGYHDVDIRPDCYGNLRMARAVK